jgi:pilus assembly protein CpaC
MSGKLGKRLMPMVLAAVITAQWLPLASSFAWATGVKGGQLADQITGSDFKPLVLAPKSTETTLRAINRISPEAAMDKNQAFILQQLDESDRTAKDSKADNTIASASVKALEGNITSIHVTRGRSQIVKFAQPILRISIAEPTMADIVPLGADQIMINGKLRGVTSLIVWDENGQEGIFDLYVQNDTSELMDAVRAVAPSEKIQARVTDDSFILTGQVSSSVVLDEIRKTVAAYGFRDDKFIDLTDTPVPQVMLEVRIAEANRTVGRILRTSFSSDNGHLQLTRLGNTLDSSILGKLVSNIAGQGQVAGRATPGIVPTRSLMQTMSASNIGGVTGGFKFNDSFTALWDLLETTGKINTLANPSLVCTHGRTASFLAGGEFPFVGSVDQNGSPVIQFKEFGVKLNFTPWISVGSGRVEMKVSPEVSNLDSSNCVAGAAGSQVCGILKRTTDTTVELMDGESLMISGILSREEQNTFAKVPFIGNVPILGNMFKNGNMSKTDRELVVVITPHIVKPSDYGKILGVAQ